MTKPNDISDDAWEAVSRAHAQFAATDNNESLQAIVARAIEAYALKKVEEATLKERKRNAATAYRVCAETRHVTLGEKAKQEILGEDTPSPNPSAIGALR